MRTIVFISAGVVEVITEDPDSVVKVIDYDVERDENVDTKDVNGVPAKFIGGSKLNPSLVETFWSPIMETMPESDKICINCSMPLIPSYDADPNGELDCMCIRCRREEEHDFDANPDVYFLRNGECVDVCEYHRDSMGWDQCSDSFFDRGGNGKGCFIQRQRMVYGEEGVTIQHYMDDRKEQGLIP